MEFPATEWIVLPDEEFELAAAWDPGQLGVDLLVQARPNGRLLDHFRLVVGGSEIVEAIFNSTDVFLVDGVPELRLHYGIWPRDIKLRRNMASGDWIDLVELVMANDVVVEGGAAEDDDGVSAADNLRRIITTQKDKNISGAAVRWAVGVAADKKLELCLQMLPGSANCLNSKPTLRG